MTRTKQTRLYILPAIHRKLHECTRIERKRRQKDGLPYRRFGLVDMVEYLVEQYLGNSQEGPSSDQSAPN